MSNNEGRCLNHRFTTYTSEQGSSLGKSHHPKNIDICLTFWTMGWRGQLMLLCMKIAPLQENIVGNSLFPYLLLLCHNILNFSEIVFEFKLTVVTSLPTTFECFVMVPVK